MSEEQEENNLSGKGNLEDAGEWSSDSEKDLRRYAFQTARFLVRKTNLPADLADDLGQKALLRYHQITKTGAAHIKDRRAYLYRIVRNEIYNQLREERAHVHSSLEDSDSTLSTLGSADTYKDVEAGILLREIWRQLEGEDRRLLELLILDYSGKELALRLGVSHEAARKRTSRLRTKLRTILGQKTDLIDHESS